MTIARADSDREPSLTWPDTAPSTSGQVGSKAAVAAIGISIFLGSAAGLSGTTSIPVAKAEIHYEAPGSLGDVAAGAALSLDAAAAASRIRARLDQQADDWNRDVPATVSWLHEASGLTWDQLGRALGVSRRAVHLWARGGRMNATNAEHLNALVGLVRELRGATPDENRSALLVSRPGGRSLFDEFRARTQAPRGDVSGTPFTPDQLLGALHDQASEET